MSNKSYAGISEEYSKLDSSKIVLIPVPYEGASTGQTGADKGPEAFLNASEHMELYDIETDTEVYKQGIYLSNPVTENASPEAVVEAVHEATKKYIKRNKFVTLFGGEHSVSIGSVRAFNELFDNLTVLHIDAHASLRKSYNGSKFNQACAMYEASQNTNLIQVGIRSMDIKETSVMDEEKIYFAHEMAVDDAWMDNVVDQLTDNVFISFDLDALDVSIMPSVGKPQPGGLFWYETLEFLKQVFEERNVVGFNIVGLCPNENSKASDFLSATLCYKMLSYKFLGSEADEDFDNNFNENSLGINKFSKFSDNDDDN
ncbi:agmatinase [Mangrovimonas sp. DI 80]|uniref:agmatinase n=1 Tax=Mangrovimonas sp. DI 80 TaxID=1779330 RepID=UPI000978D0EC|nr:agmatinase [Mangrovimonas sp. DI 80]OMP31870.1 agmatinase [Mangrovimonas sp. DI 80]